MFKLPPPSALSQEFYQLIQEQSDKQAVEHAQALEAYIKTYLNTTGADVRDLVLVEQRFYAPNSITTKYWLETKPTDHP